MNSWRSQCNLYLPLARLRLVCDPLKGTSSHETNNQKVIAPKACRIFPIVTILIRTLEGDIENRALVCIAAPDAGTHGPVADLMHGLIIV
jgi:hypothetical protein